MASIMYSEEESGYLAGYAAVKDGMTKLGYGWYGSSGCSGLRLRIPAGAEDTAKDPGLADGAISVTYHYTGDLLGSTNKATAKQCTKEGSSNICLWRFCW